jgi:hypothetical protein
MKFVLLPQETDTICFFFIFELPVIQTKTEKFASEARGRLLEELLLASIH